MTKIPKYSKLEHERRWLVKSPLPPVVASMINEPSFTEIEDLYIEESRLRLRKMTVRPSGETTYKLCKKYGAMTSTTEPITNIYLSEIEYATLTKLAGQRLTKRRYKLEENGYVFAIDVFANDVFDPRSASAPANGAGDFVICEIETGDEAELLGILEPSFTAKEISGDAAYSGHALAGQRTREPERSFSKH